MFFLAEDIETDYGPAAAAVLRAVADRAEHCINKFILEFYKSLRRVPETNAILERLTDEEFKHLMDQKTRHLRALWSPDLDHASHIALATRVGRVHALVGLEMLWLVAAFAMHDRTLTKTLTEDLVDPELGRQLHAIIDHRMFRDLEAQGAAARQVEAEVAAVLADIQQLSLQAENITDLYLGAMKSLVSIEGITACFAGGRNARGLVEVEGYDGPKAEPYLAAMYNGLIPPISINEADDAHDGPTSRAWKSGKVVVVASYLRDPAVAPWRKVGAELGFRSVAIVPLLDETGQTFSVLNIYSRWPGFFSLPSRTAFLENLQLSFGGAVAKHSRGHVIPEQTRRMYAQMLRDRRLKMLYQPIIDLQTGALVKVEALARLHAGDNLLIGPEAFLPAMSGQNLLAIFEQGLTQLCEDLVLWRAQGLKLQAAINLPPQGITDPSYHEALFRTLAATNTPPGLIELEVLETQDNSDAVTRDKFFQSLREAGIAVVQDDLGAGHSSLLRMDSMPFDAVKIDQGLVMRSAKRDPVRTLEFIYHLTHLAHALDVPVTIEGLEHTGVIEASAMLGADRGQGFGISRPMPAGLLAGWWKGFKYDVDVKNPATALGVLAGHLMWNRQLKAIYHWPEIVDAFLLAPSVVQNYINQRHLQSSPLQDLLNSNHVFARKNPHGKQFHRTSREISKILSDMWRDQHRG